MLAGTGARSTDGKGRANVLAVATELTEFGETRAVERKGTQHTQSVSGMVIVPTLNQSERKRKQRKNIIPSDEATIGDGTAAVGDLIERAAAKNCLGSNAALVAGAGGAAGDADAAGATGPRAGGDKAGGNAAATATGLLGAAIRAAANICLGSNLGGLVGSAGAAGGSAAETALSAASLCAKRPSINPLTFSKLAAVLRALSLLKSNLGMRLVDLRRQGRRSLL